MVAPPAGLEPATKSLEVTRSIQLSYGGWARQGYLPHAGTTVTGSAARSRRRYASPVDETTTPGRRLRFLVVDDTDDIREVMTRMVERQGHRADQAVDGVEAVEALQQTRYDLMLLDLSMPRMTGEEVVRWVQQHPEHATGLRVVVVSAWAGDKRPVLQELGITDVLPKPFRRQQLEQLIAESL